METTSEIYEQYTVGYFFGYLYNDGTKLLIHIILPMVILRVCVYTVKDMLNHFPTVIQSHNKEKAA